MKRLWMPLYVADYLADTAHLSTIEHGAYILLIMHYWTKGSLPSDDDTVRRITRLDKRQWVAHRDILASMFLTGWRHKRIDNELAKAIEKSKANSANAHKRHAERTSNAERSDTQSQLQSEEIITTTSFEERPIGAKAPLLEVVKTNEKPDARVYRRGREILGPSGGGLVTRVIKAKGGNLNLAMALLEQAAAAGDPKPYLAKAIRNIEPEYRNMIDGDTGPRSQL
jgi:uncharacterized protein YdaU (DUF1376 family)